MDRIRLPPRHPWLMHINAQMPRQKPQPLPYSKPPSMSDVARAAGVHQTTVSRALRNDPRIPEATSRRVRRVAERLHYRPNPMVSALIALRRSRHPHRFPVTLAFVAHTSGRWRRTQPRLFTFAYEAHLAGARAAAERQGYHVELFPIDSPGMTERRLNEILFTRNIPGLIIGSFPDAHGQFVLDWERFCTVVIEYTFTQPAFDRIVHDSYDGMRQIMGECARRHHDRVGLMLTAAGHERTEYLNGAAYWMEQKSGRRFAAIPPLFVAAWDEREFEAWHAKHRPQVIVTSNALIPDFMALCEKKGWRLGTDIHLVNVNAAAEGPETGIYQDPFMTGVTAARMVIERIGRNARGIPERRQTILTQGRWIDGSTMGQAPLSRVSSAL